MLSRQLIYNVARKTNVFKSKINTSQVVFNNLIHTTTYNNAETPHGLSDEEIAVANLGNMQPVVDVAKRRFDVEIGEDDLEVYGRYKAKIPFNFIKKLEKEEDGKLILVTAMSPTRFGEGKTCTSVGLGDGLCQIGKNAMVSLREPSLEPVFGVKVVLLVVDMLKLFLWQY